MRKGWEYKKFTDVCNVTYGYAFDSKCFTDNPEDTPLIRIRDVKRGFSETFYNGEIPDGYTVMEGDYLVGMDGEFNIGQWGKRPGVLNQRVCKMNSSSSELINQYMYYFMKVCLKSIEDETPFVTVKHLSAKRINMIQIPLPPKSTQLAIVSELDKINELIRLKKEQLKDFDNLAQSLFYEMFGDPVENEKGWEVKKLGEIYTFIDYRGKTPTKIKSGIPLITAKNVKRGFLDYTIAEYISPQDFLQRQSRGIAQKGDLLFTTEAPLGNVAIANISVFSTGQRLIALQQKCELENRYVMFHMLTDYFQDVLKKHATGSTAQGIQAAKLKHIPIPLPPLPLQHLFAQRIEQIEREKSEIQKSIQDLETLLASRMQYWFE